MVRFRRVLWGWWIGITRMGRAVWSVLVGVGGETAGVADAGDAVVTVLDRFLSAGISREEFDAHLAAGRIAVAGERIADPATPAPTSTAVAIMLDP